MTHFLIGDVGGTKTLLALARSDGTYTYTTRYSSHEFQNLPAMVHTFLKQVPTYEKPQKAVFGVAGPVVDQRSSLTNLPWLLNERELAEELQLQHVQLMNDFEATAYGVLQLSASSIETLQHGTPKKHSPIGVIGAGTGLGEAWLIPSVKKDQSIRYHVLPSEGGHADFAPQSDREIALLQFVRQRYGHVSYERILSGSGIVTIYEFIRDAEHFSEPSHLQQGDTAAIISTLALEKQNSLCIETLDMFVRIYGAEAGNVALRGLTYGGLFIAGGIAPKIIPLLRQGAFLEAFRKKGRASTCVENVPVHVVLDTNIVLAGAAYVARCSNETEM